MNAQPLLTIDELAARAGVPIRTVRFYIAEGLLPGASTRGKGASYTREHLERLQLIRLLVARHLPLAEVRALTTSLPPGEVHAVVQEEQARTGEVSAQASEPASPKEYLSALLDQARGYSTQRTTGGVVGSGGAGSRAWPLQEGEDQPAPSPSPSLPAPPAPSPRAPSRSAQTRLGEQALPWHRWELAPGIELQVRADVARAEAEVIERLLNALRAALAPGSVNTIDQQQKE
ncbi:MAG: MerR family transcriptional regulator [Ktedonobacterales bacterium]